MISLNGKTKLNGRPLSIYWTGQHSQHIAENHELHGSVRPLHLAIQKALQSAINVKLQRNTFMGVKQLGPAVMRIIWEKKSNFAVIKTAQLFNSTPEKILKSKGIGKTKKQPARLTTEDLPEEEKKFADEAGVSLGNYVAALNKIISAKKKRRR